MIKIAICDDEAWCRDELWKYCQTYFAQVPYGNPCMPKGQGREIEMGLEYELAEYASGEELWEAIAAAGENREGLWDILLLDIEMPGMSGIEVKNRLQQKRQELRILFITSHEEAMPEAFGSRVFGFLKKPLEYEIFRQRMDPVLADIKDYEKYVTVENETGARKIYLKQILYIQGYGKYTQLFLEGEASYVFSGQSLGKWKERLKEDGFFQCHKSYLVNFEHVKRVKEEIALTGEKRIPVSRRIRRECQEQYRKYLWEKAR